MLRKGSHILVAKGGEAGMVEKTNFIKVKHGKPIRLKTTVGSMRLSVVSTMLDRQLHPFLKGGTHIGFAGKVQSIW